MRRIWEALLFIFAKRSNAPENSPAADAFKELIVCRLKAMYNSNSDKDIGTKRIISIGENDFIMTKRVYWSERRRRWRIRRKAKLTLPKRSASLSRVRSKFIVHLCAVSEWRTDG